jgi:hypothetical protein
MAEQGNGLYMYVQRRDAATISNAMCSILTNILDRLCGETEDVLSQIEGFTIFDTSSIVPVANEAEAILRQGNMTAFANNSSEVSKYLNTKMEKMIMIIGAGWSKRKIELDPECLLYQMKLIAHCLVYFTGDSDSTNIEACL